MRLMSLRSLALASGFASFSSLSYASSEVIASGMLDAAPAPVGLEICRLIALFVALSAMYAYIFRQVCRKGSPVPTEFSLLRGTLFFAWAPLLATLIAAIVSLPLAILSPPSFVTIAINIAVTVCGTAELSRAFLLKLPRAAMTYLRALSLTAVTFAIAGGVFQLARLLLGALL